MGAGTTQTNTTSRRRRACWLHGLALLACGALAAIAHATTSAGLPFMQNFAPDDYRGAAQNWSLAQDRQGLIYVGNVESGVLVFDGARWQRIPVPNQAAVRSLGTGPDGRIYVGTVGDLGYLAPDANGKLGFVSLRDLLPADERHFADVWSTLPARDGVYFTTHDSIYLYAHGRMRVWKPQTSFHLSFMVDGTLYVREPGRGLFALLDGRLQLLPGGERFAQERIYALLPWHDAAARPGDLLIGTRSQGWYVYQHGQLHRWNPEAAQAINSSAIYSARWLSDGQLAVATLRGGLFLLDAQGHLVHAINHSNGLRSDMVLATLEGRQHGLWLATGNGITRVGVDAALSIFDARNGLRGEVQALRRFDGTLYAGTSEGLYRLDEGIRAHFTRIEQVNDQIWDFAVVDGILLAGGENGIHVLAADGSWQQLPTDAPAHSATALALLTDPRDASRVFVGGLDGLSVLQHTATGWRTLGKVAGVTGEVRTLNMDATGQLWCGLWGGGLMRLSFPPGWQGPGTTTAPVTLAHYGHSDGLPQGLVQPVPIDGVTHFATALGVYRYDAASGRFAPDPRFANLFAGATPAIDSLHQDRRGTVWMTISRADGTRQTGRVVHMGGHWQWQDAALQSLGGTGVNVFLDDPDGTVWLGSDNGLYRDLPGNLAAPPGPVPTLLRMAGVNGGAAYFDHYLDTHQPRLAHDRNAIRFEFALPSYSNTYANTYQVWLQGLDAGWSPWSDQSYRDYTSLPPGSYVFHVRGRNLHGQIGRTASFAFRILPPWYGTLWAWLLWLALGLLALYLLLRWRSATLRQRNRTLEALVERRTSELAAANHALREANAALSLQAVTDPLTGLRNRRYLRENIKHDLSALTPSEVSQAADQPLVFLMVDIDHFKRVNDTWGHAAGDRVLQQLGDILLAATRKSDTAIRRGGEEFLIVARLDAPDAGAQLSERVRSAVAAHIFDLGEGLDTRITCSVGFASYPPFADAAELPEWEQVVSLADACLYAAKRSGRNAWIGMAPMPQAPETNLMDALRASLDAHPDPGPLILLASWPARAATTQLSVETVS